MNRSNPLPAEVVTSLMVGEAAGRRGLRPFGSVAAFEDAQREINEWFEGEWTRLLADKRAKEREIERKFWNGEYRHG